MIYSNKTSGIKIERNGKFEKRNSRISVCLVTVPFYPKV